jgi:hypothetical protein
MDNQSWWNFLSHLTSHPQLPRAWQPLLPTRLFSAYQSIYVAQPLSPPSSRLCSAPDSPARSLGCALRGPIATEVNRLQGRPLPFSEVPASLSPYPVTVCICHSIPRLSKLSAGHWALLRCLQP